MNTININLENATVNLQEMEEVTCDFLAMQDESWWVAPTQFGQWAAWSSASDRITVFPTREEAMEHWAEAAEALLGLLIDAYAARRGVSVEEVEVEVYGTPVPHGARLSTPEWGSEEEFGDF